MGLPWELSLISDRSFVRHRRVSRECAREIAELAREWDMTLAEETSAWPLAAGLVWTSVPVVCGLGPVVRGLHTVQEAVNRLSLMQRTLLLAQVLALRS